MVTEELTTIKPRHHERQFWINTKRLLKIPLAVFGFAIILIIVFCAIFAPLISPYNPNAQSKNYLQPPSATNLLGTDQLGRDVLSRTIYGSRVALIVSLGAISIGVVIGVPLGLIAGNSRGWIDEVIMRIMDALLAFPSLVIAIGLVAVLGSTLLNVIIAIGISNIPFIARIVRAQALQVREQPYIMASHSIGSSSWRVIFRHILPNSMAPVIVQSTLGMAYAILTEAALGFLGLGVPPPTPTWGNMLQFAFPVLDRAAYLSIVPGLAIFLLVLAFNFTGDALRDVLDPRLRGLFR